MHLQVIYLEDKVKSVSNLFALFLLLYMKVANSVTRHTIHLISNTS